MPVYGRSQDHDYFVYLFFQGLSQFPSTLHPLLIVPFIGPSIPMHDTTLLPISHTSFFSGGSLVAVNGSWDSQICHNVDQHASVCVETGGNIDSHGRIFFLGAVYRATC